jgi:hypothetical protein
MAIGDALAPTSVICDALIDKRVVDEDTSYGHLIAMESAHGVLRLTMACSLRFDNRVCLSSGLSLLRRARWFAIRCSCLGFLLSTDYDVLALKHF